MNQSLTGLWELFQKSGGESAGSEIPNHYGNLMFKIQTRLAETFFFPPLINNLTCSCLSSWLPFMYKSPGKPHTQHRPRNNNRMTRQSCHHARYQEAHLSPVLGSSLILHLASLEGFFPPKKELSHVGTGLHTLSQNIAPVVHDQLQLASFMTLVDVFHLHVSLETHKHAFYTYNLKALFPPTISKQVSYQFTWKFSSYSGLSRYYTLSGETAFS